MSKLTSLHSLMKVKQTQLEMMKARNYDISDEETILVDTSLVYFIKFYKLDVTNKQEYGEKLSNWYRHIITNKECNIFYTLSYYGGDKCYIPQADIQLFVRSISNNEKCDSGIIISSKMASNNANNILRSSSISLKYTIQHFLVEELVFNPIKHFLVPVHRVLSDVEKNIFFKENKYTQASHLPIIKAKNLHTTSKNKKDQFGDPVAKYYAMKHDDIVCVNRINFVESVMTTEYVIFRRVEAIL